MNPTSWIAKTFVFTILSAIVLIAATLPVNAAKGKKNQVKPKQTKLWQQVEERSLQLSKQRTEGKRLGLPEKYLLFRLDNSSLQSQLKKLPLENTNAARDESVVMEIPLADGSIQRFRMEETAVLSPELAAQYPTWKTFVGYGIDNPQAIGRFDWNIQGFHGYIESGKGTVLIDPYQKGDTENYVVFYKHEYGKSGTDFSCKVNDQMSKITNSEYKSNFLPSAPEFAFGANLRTFKIAIATTGEWSRNAAGFAANPALTPQQIRDNAFAVVTTSVQRLNGIFVRELGSTFQLNNPVTTDDTKNIIFDDPATDPYNNTDNTAQLTINQTTLDSRVGTANYDIGHLYGTGGGGVASEASLCQNGTASQTTQFNNSKAEGYSARDNETGDPFVVDYVAHEIGHQFGSDHTYNNVDPSGTCTTRSAGDAFEVASGATIMSYVGICADRNLQNFVDPGFPSFHIRSMTTINTNMTTGAPAQLPCGTTSTETNAIPTINAGASFNIPRLTPFTLTATGGDGDDPAANLLYSWEQYDLAPSASGAVGTPPGTFDVDNDGVLRPLFRVYSPISGNARTYPSLVFILNPAGNDATADVNGVRGNQPVLTYTGPHPTGAPGAVCETNKTCVIGERLPTIERTMNFRVSLRDRRGGVQDAGTTVMVAGNAGPFQITVQNSTAPPPTALAPVLAPEATWQARTMQTVTWDVANTNIAPVSAALVNILLSTDGGQTFPIVLAANTANDGTEQITVPNNPTSMARIKVEAVGNIFFDINNANFAITAPTAATVSVSGRVVSSVGRGISNAQVSLTDQNGDVRNTRTNTFGYYRFSNVVAGQTYVLNVSHKRYQSVTRVASLVEDTSEFNFTVANHSR